MTVFHAAHVKENAPVGAISMGADHYEIDPNACTDCGTCAGVCPVEAIKQA